MRSYSKTFLIGLFFFISGIATQAQTIPSQINQVELMKQFFGKWKCELGKDTFLLSENIPFGTGMISSSQIVANGETLDSIKQLYGYDKKMDRFIVAELIKSSPVVEICTAWFTSKNAGEITVTNPDNAPFNFRFEFKTPDSIVQTAISDGKVIKEIRGIRIK